MNRPTLFLLTIVISLLTPANAGESQGWSNPILQQRADPHVMLHSDGWYYLTATAPEYDRIELRRAKTLGGLAQADANVIWRKHPLGPMSAHFWAPEIHLLKGKWETPLTTASRPLRTARQTSLFITPGTMRRSTGTASQSRPGDPRAGSQLET